VNNFVPKTILHNNEEFLDHMGQLGVFLCDTWTMPWREIAPARKSGHFQSLYIPPCLFLGGNKV